MESLGSLVLRNRVSILTNLGDAPEASTVAENRKRKKMKSSNLWLQPQQIEVAAEVRNWLDLPVDVLCIIFKKLGAFDIVYSVQLVCSLWRSVSKKPHLFRSIKLSHPPWYFGNADINVTKIEKQTVDRSRGQLAVLSMAIYDTEEVLHYALDKPNSLEFLELARVSADGLMNAITKVPFLEKLVLSLDGSGYYFPEVVIAEIGRSCPQLKHFSWYSKDTSYHQIRNHNEYEDEEVLAVAEYMPQLRELHLNGNTATNKGLRAILHGCLYMEHLDLEKCYYTVELSEELLNECRERIKTFKCPTRHHISDGHGLLMF